MDRSLDADDRMDVEVNDEISPSGEIVFSLQEWGELQQVPLIVADLSGRVLEILPNGSAELEKLHPLLLGQNLRELPASSAGNAVITFERLWEGLLTSGMQGDVTIGFSDPTGELHLLRGTGVVVLRKDQVEEEEVQAHVVLAFRPKGAGEEQSVSPDVIELCTTIRRLVHDINNDLTTCLCELAQIKNHERGQSQEEFQKRIELMEGLLLEISGKNRKVSSLCRK
ncbi:MAG: hypothetical protein U0903_16280 [Planctomycetales bacterium]